MLVFLFVPEIQKYNWYLYRPLYTLLLYCSSSINSSSSLISQKHLFIENLIIGEWPFNFFFPVFILLCFSLDIAKTSSRVLNRSCNSEHPYLISDLMCKAFSNHPLSMAYAVGYFCRFLNQIKKLSTTSLLRVFFFLIINRW